MAYAVRLYRQAVMQTIGFGPIGFGAHGPDEFVNVDSLVKTAKVYLALALRLAEASSPQLYP